MSRTSTSTAQDMPNTVTKKMSAPAGPPHCRRVSPMDSGRKRRNSAVPTAEEAPV